MRTVQCNGMGEMPGHEGEDFDFLCPICRKHHATTERGNIKKKLCYACEDELIGDMMI